MSYIAYSVRRQPGGNPVVAERRRRAGWLRTSLAAMLLALPILPVMAADAPGVSVTSIHDFTGSDGQDTYASVISGADGFLYGATIDGGANGQGAIYKVAPDGTGFQILHNFTGSDGNRPFSPPLQGPDGTLYGTADSGGASGGGVVYKIQPNGTGFQILHNFQGADGWSAVSNLTLINGFLYGATEQTDDVNGSVYKVAVDGSNFQSLHTFASADGTQPYGALALGPDGALYGTASSSGANNSGTLYKINLDGSGFQDIHAFTGADGSYPWAGLVLGADNRFYGTTVSGGANNDGTVFRINPDGSGFQDLHDFTSVEGTRPYSTLALGADGNYYGTTTYDGASENGTIYKISADGSGFQNLHDFTGTEGSDPYSMGGLIQGTDGKFYGTAYYGGSGDGTIFQMTLGPATTASLSGPQGAHGWYTGDVTVTLTATDPSAAITNTYYSVDGGTQLAYTGPFVVSGDLAHTVTFHSEDAHGTVESDETQAVNIDGTLPTLTFGTASPTANAAGWNNTSVSVPFTASDATSGVDTPGTSGTATVNTEGQNQTQTVTVTDVAGNHQDFTTPAFNIDLTAPVTNDTVVGAQTQNGDYTTPPLITLSATDNLSGVAATYYSIDFGTDQPYTGPFTVPDGNHVVLFYSVDVAGNVEAYDGFGLSADTTAPVTTASLSGTLGTNGWYTGDVTVVLSATDAGSGVASTVYSIDGGASQPYTGSFTVSGDLAHTVTFHSVDADGNVEADETQTINIDGTAPTLTFGTPSPAANAAGWNNTDVSVPYTAADATSGVATAVPGGPLTISGEGFALSQSVTVTDVAGNSAAFNTPTIKIDRTKPVTVAATQSGTAGQTVTLSATDNLSGVAATVYSIDGGADQPYTAPFTVSGDGDHTVSFHSVDNAGNAEDAQQVHFTVQIPSPITTASLSGTQGDNGWYTGPVTVTLAAQAIGVPVATTYYTIDGGAQQTYTAPFTVSGDAAPHTVVFWSVDIAGNVEAQNQLPVKIDGTAPTLTVGAASPVPNAAGWNNSPVTFTVSGTDATSGFAGTTPAGPITFSGAGKGQTQAVTGKDNAGNEATVSTPVVNIDLTAPTTTASPSGSVNSDGSYTTSATVTLSASDDLSGVAGTTYAIDGGTAQPYTKPFTVSGTGTHTVTFSSTDVAGNAEASKTLTVTVAAPAIPVLHTFPAGLQMIAVSESYGAASTALSPAPSKLAVWSPSLVQYTLSDGSASLAPGQGYWVRFSQSTNLLDAGTPTPTSQPFTVSLQKGWNMIGDPFSSAVSLSGVTVSSAGKSYTFKTANLAGLVSATLYSYPAGSSAYQTTGADGSLSPYTGYWVYAFQPCSLVIPAAQ